MGSPLGPTLANAFLCHFKNKCLSEYPVEFLQSVYKRYVDEIFVTFNSYLQLLKFVNYINHQHPNSKFTFVIEKNNNFSFLDVKSCREKNKFTTSVFRKPTFSGVFTHLDGFVPISYKHGLANMLILRFFKICSSNEKLQNEISRKFLSVTDILMTLLIFVLKSFLMDSILPKKVYQTVEKKQLLIILPFLCHLSFETRNRLNSCKRNQLISCSLRIEFQSKTHLSGLFKLK